MIKEELEKRAFAEADKVVIGKGMDKSAVVHLRHLLKNMYVNGAISETELLSQHIAELEKENAEAKERIKTLEYRCEDIKDTDTMELVALQKENAELKTKVTALENANRAMVKELDDTTSGGLSVLENVVRSKEQLSNAKELLKEFIHHYKAKTIYIENMQDLLEQAEQFLKDSEVEK